MKKCICLLVIILFWVSCKESSPVSENPEPPEEEVYVLPIVVHVIHNGEEIGMGTNISIERIERQIEILNEDFRRKEGTRGYNEHPDGGDTRIEFMLAKQDPDGNPTNGIVRKKLMIEDLPADIPNTEYEQYGYFSFWDSEQYINIWTAPYPEDFANLLLGKATGPDSDLSGDSLFQKPFDGGAEGIIINWAHFGESDLEGGHNLGRTLTHEMGHYLGLLHPWGTNECETNDYCEDTPAVDSVVRSSTPYIGCNGEEVMIANYMNYTPDHVMNVFTNDQITRMHYVLENSPRRNSLLNSPAKNEVSNSGS